MKGDVCNVLVLMPSLFFGGSEKQVRYIIEGMESKGINCTVLIENGNEDDEINHMYITNHKDVKWIFLKGSIITSKDKTILNKAKAIFNISMWLISNTHKYKYDWIMCTNLTGLCMVPLYRLLNIKVLFNERNSGTQICNASWKRFLLKKCTKIVANSQSATNYMEGILKNKNIECINNGIDIEKANTKDRLDNEIKNKGKYILIPARICPIKNQMQVLKAIRGLINGTDHSFIDKFCIIFAGKTDDIKYENSLKVYIEENKLQSKIEFAGYVSNMDDYYKNASLVILASSEEGTPNVILESYLYKCLCLASDIVMNRDIAVDERMLFDLNDAKSLEKRILWALSLDDSTLCSILEKGYKFVNENYSLETMQEKYIEIFHS